VGPTTDRISYGSAFLLSHYNTRRGREKKR
jgi:hypothetical protein